MAETRSKWADNRVSEPAVPKVQGEKTSKDNKEKNMRVKTTVKAGGGGTIKVT